MDNILVIGAAGQIGSELVIELRAADQKPIDVLKIQNIILAAPDLDFGVVERDPGQILAQ